jgi:hypothetical protein
MNNWEMKTSVDALRGKRAIIFVRARDVPHGPAGEFAQLVAQERVCRQVARGLNAKVGRVFAVYGETTEPVAIEMVERVLLAVEQADINYLVAQGYGRLTPCPDELTRIVRRLGGSGTRLVTTADPAAFVEQIALRCLLGTTTDWRNT